MGHQDNQRTGAWDLIGTLSFKEIPWQMKIEFIYFVVLWFNAFSVKIGILAAYSPQEFLVHWKLDYTEHCWVFPCTYCEAHNKPVSSNTMIPRTHKMIVLGPTGNLQRSVKFYCLKTGRHEANALRPTGNLKGSVKFHCLNTECMLKRRLFTALPMLNWVIKKQCNRCLKKQGREFWFLN